MGSLAFSFVALRLQHSFIFLLIFLVFSGIGIALPCLDALITGGIDKEERGTITSFYSAMSFLGVVTGPHTYAYMMSVSDHLIFMCRVGLVLLP
jgi:MFS transporter, ACDE family, multidrug resistance protein